MSHKYFRLLPPGWRRGGYSLLILLAVFGILETAARGMDRRHHFYYRVRHMLSSLEIKTQPMGIQENLPWPDKAIYIRASEPETDRAKKEKYIVGGKLIPGGHETLKMRLVTPSAFEDDPRKKIFVVGGSAAFGFPYLYPHSLAAQLQSLLPDEEYRVVNAAQISFPSGKVFPVVQRIVEYYHPHTLVIFTGNNEWMNWKAFAAPWHLQMFIRTFHTLSESRLLAYAVMQGLKWKVHRDRDLRRRRDQFVVAKEIQGFEYALDNPLEKYYSVSKQSLLNSKKSFLRTFEHNLSAMITLARRHQVRVILLTVPFNHRLSPAFMVPQPVTFRAGLEEQMQQELQAAAGLIRQGDHTTALARLQEAQRLDPQPPLLHYLKGIVLEKLGQDRAAEKAYAQSRENMIGHLGGRLSINRVIKKASTQYSIPCLDVQNLFSEYNRRRGKFFNEDLVLDDCHPSPLGHRLIARELLRLLQTETLPAGRP